MLSAPQVFRIHRLQLLPRASGELVSFFSGGAGLVGVRWNLCPIAFVDSVSGTTKDQRPLFKALSVRPTMVFPTLILFPQIRWIQRGSLVCCSNTACDNRGSLPI
jgi:hypothetical protein